MNRWRTAHPGAALALVLVAGFGLAGCGESLENSAGCPITCTDQSAQVQTVTLDAVTTSATVPGGFGRGTETQMLLANRGDTLDTRVVIRFDSLPSRGRISSADTTTTPIAVADSAYLTLHVDSSAVNATVPITLSFYDVDSAAVDDTSAAALQGLFTPARLITQAQFAPGTLVDSVRILLPSSFVLAKAQNLARMRLGLRISASQSVSIRIASSEVTTGPSLSMRTSPDTAIDPILVVPYSKTPADNRSIALSLSDFTVVVKGTPPPPAGLLAVGGLPGTRAYLRFDIPSRIVDSSLVVRATLLLTQQPSSSPDPADSMLVVPYLVVAGPTVTDPVKAAQIFAPVTSAAFNPVGVFPGASGVREFDVAPAFTFWALQSEDQLPRAVELQSSQEDFSPQQSLFYSSSASDPTLRPKLRISYTLRSRIGLP